MSKKVGEKRIMAFGTFDGLHKGHINFLQQARKLSKNPFLIISVARDKNVLKIKGAKPLLNENKRMLLLRSSKLVDKVVLSGAKNHIPHIVKEYPEIIALGYDQKEYIKNLKKDLKEKGLNTKIVRLNPHKEHIYKNHLLKNKKSKNNK